MKLFRRSGAQAPAYLLLSLLFVGLTACGEVTNMRRNSNLQDTLMHYELVMNRSNFVAAARFRLPSAKWNTQGLDRFQLTHYEVKQTNPADDGNRLERDVLLRYIDRYTMREREQMNREIWIFNSKAGQWQLDGKPPVFR
jgi:hypothetical protein